MDNNELTSFLIHEKKLDKNIIKNALDIHQKTGQSLLNILKEQNVLNEELLIQTIAYTSGIEFINLTPEMIEPMIAHLIPYETANKYNLIPIKSEANNLKVAMSSPLNLSVRSKVEMKTGYKVIPVAATPSAIRQAIHQKAPHATIPMPDVKPALSTIQ